MMSQSDPLVRLFAMAAAVGVVFVAFTPAAIGIAVAGNNSIDGAGNEALAVGVQQGAGSVTVSVSHNGTAVNNSTVNVTANQSYNGSGEYTTDETGTVSLPSPDVNETVTVTITATKETNGSVLTGSTTATLHGNAGQGAPFVPLGQRIAAFVHGLEENGGIVAIGPFVADYVHALAPVGGPVNAGAGPPPWIADAAGPSSEENANNMRGPSSDGPPGKADRSATKDNGHGRSEDAGPPDEANESSTENDGNGPPDDPGPPRGHDDDDHDDEDEENEGEGRQNGDEEDHPGEGRERDK